MCIGNSESYPVKKSGGEVQNMWINILSNCTKTVSPALHNVHWWELPDWITRESTLNVVQLHERAEVALGPKLTERLICHDVCYGKITNKSGIWIIFWRGIILTLELMTQKSNHLLCCQLSSEGCKPAWELKVPRFRLQLYGFCLLFGLREIEIETKASVSWAINLLTRPRTDVHLAVICHQLFAHNKIKKGLQPLS